MDINTSTNYRVIATLAALKDYLADASVVAFDFECSPDAQWRGDIKAALDPHKAHIVGVSFSKEKGGAVYLPIAHKVGRNASDGMNGGTTEIWAWLTDNFFTNHNIVKVAHNLAFEASFLYSRGIVIQAPVYDTIAAAQMTLKTDAKFRSLAESGLKTLVPEIYKVDLPTFAAVTGDKHFDELNPQDPAAIRYACADSDFTLRLYHTINKWFDKWMPRHRFIVEEIESPTAVYVGLMKYNGMAVDRALMDAKAAECEAKLEQLREDIAFIIGDVNIGANASTAAFKQYLYQDLKLPVLKSTAKFQEAADDETLVLLAEWCAANRPELAQLFKLIQEYRKIGKLKTTYIDGYLKHVNAATGRIHADLMPLATETGRFAARNPNLQNMPRAGADEVGVRNFFVAPEGMLFLSLDLSQIELRIGAFYCRDEKMLQTYRENGDIHNSTADVVFGEKKHDKEERTIAKNVNFGTFYGLFPKGLQRTLKFKAGVEKTFGECETIIANLKNGYPRLGQWQRDTIKQAKEDRFVETWLGRRRYLPDINSPNWSKKSFGERCALNTPIQGTAADCLKLAMARIVAGLPERPWLMPLLQIHDELVFEVSADKVDEAAAFVKSCMEAQPFPECDVPIIAAASAGQAFGVMKELD